jgi:hypothetical protein
MLPKRCTRQALHATSIGQRRALDMQRSVALRRDQARLLRAEPMP